jgi:hypothetical protein
MGAGSHSAVPQNGPAMNGAVTDAYHKPLVLIKKTVYAYTA